MGVLNMAIPFPAGFGLTPAAKGFAPGGGDTPQALPGRTPRSSPSEPANAAPKLPEVRVQRSPEQQAEQDALVLLVRQCMAGDQRAWHRMVTSQHKRVFGICYRFTGSQSDAEDITQDVFLKVYRNLASFDPEKGSFQTWLTTLTRNMLVDQFRRTRLERATDSMDASSSGDDDGPTFSDRLADTRPSQEQNYAGLELKARIQDALAKVSPELREAVILRDLEDMDYKEIALVLKIPEGTVKSRISRGRAELARLLQRIERQVM
jgi:RNA polymerase sigma-70 factor (ECF subfamily)